MKILLLQPNIIRKYNSKFRLKIYNNLKIFFQNLKLKKFQKYFNIKSQISISSELNHYGDFVKILGKDSVTSIERFHPAYFNLENKEYLNYMKIENYPSNFGYERPKFIKKKDIIKNLKNFDVVFASIYFGENLEEICWKAKKANKMVVLFDNIDHEEVYYDIKKIFRGFNYDMFDIYFKKDIPLSFEDDKIYPIAPVPCKLNFFEKKNINQYKSSSFKSEIFFVGAYRENITRYERLEICNFVKNMEQKNRILLNEKNIKFNDYLFFANNTKFNLSPGGRVWCSYRHTDLANFKRPIILPKPNCQTVPGEFIDSKNSILYETELKNNRVIIKDNLNDLREKINFYLNNDTQRDIMGKNYFDLISRYHTTFKRAQYLIEKIKNKL